MEKTNEQSNKNKKNYYYHHKRNNNKNTAESGSGEQNRRDETKSMPNGGYTSASRDGRDVNHGVNRSVRSRDAGRDGGRDMRGRDTGRDTGRDMRGRDTGRDGGRDIRGRDAGKDSRDFRSRDNRDNSSRSRDSRDNRNHFRDNDFKKNTGYQPDTDKQAIRKFILGTFEQEEKNYVFSFDAGTYRITEKEGTAEDVPEKELLNSRDKLGAYQNWNEIKRPKKGRGQKQERKEEHVK